MSEFNKEKIVYLNTYVLQQDMRIRLPKSILNNLKIERGKTNFAIYLDSQNKEIILKIAPLNMGVKNEQKN